MQKTVNTKAKKSLRSSIMIQDLNIYYFKDYCSSYYTSSKVQIQSSNNKNSSHFEKFKLKDLKPALSYNNIAKIIKKENKKVKKKWF